MASVARHIAQYCGYDFYFDENEKPKEVFCELLYLTVKRYILIKGTVDNQPLSLFYLFHVSIAL